jgi:selenide,water dikinase
MVELNQAAADVLRPFAPNAVTDVTGFGLLGHAHEIATRSGATVVIEADAVPLLPDARRFAAEGATTGGGGRNRAQLGDGARLPADLDPVTADLLYDPQTSGGLLVALPADRAEALRARIEAETGGCWRVGSVEAGAPVVEVR